MKYTAIIARMRDIMRIMLRCNMFESPFDSSDSRKPRKTLYFIKLKLLKIKWVLIFWKYY